MTNEEINIAIAEICGWTQCQWNGAYDTLRGVPPVYPSAFQDIPNYVEDLIAMHEAEKMLITPVLEKKWITALTLTVHGKSPRKRTSNKMVRASARQRAEAFLRVFGKGKGGAA